MKFYGVIAAMLLGCMLWALEVKVGETGTLVQNGRHNAFPSICRNGDALYFSFRSATGHRMRDGILPVYQSTDEGKSWKKIAEISGKGDLRDPRCVTVNGKFMIYAGEVFHNADNSRNFVNRVYCMEKGGKFTELPMTGIKEDSFIWGVVAYDGGYAATAYVPKKACADLYKSKDGLNWQHWLTLPGKGNEVSMTVDGAGELHCIMRTSGSKTFHPIYFQVSKEGKITSAVELSEGLQGIMLQSVGDGFLLAARHWNQGRPGPEDFRTDLFTMDRKGKLTFIQRLPSSDDTSYAFTVQLKNGKWYTVYYSQHNYRKEFRSSEKSYNWQRKLGTSRPADICFAVLETDPVK